ncbi:MAG: hypothetical protein GEU98_13670 [Pseudonocardiaceae bacterium]|nr:hypothetical protein [Pseudonocardiaceae bacterium]
MNSDGCETRTARTRSRGRRMCARYVRALTGASASERGRGLATARANEIEEWRRSVLGDLRRNAPDLHREVLCGTLSLRSAETALADRRSWPGGATVQPDTSYSSAHQSRLYGL